MIRSSTACTFALITLPGIALAGMLLGCTEPSGTGGTMDAPPPVAIADPVPSEVPVPAEDAAVLAAGDPAASDGAQPEPEADSTEVAEVEDAEAGEQAEAGEEAPQPDAVLEPRRVLIVGSSLAATGLGAVLEKMLDANPDVVCYRKAKSSTGLARPDFYDWYDQGKRQIEFRKPDLVLVLMGANDGQDIVPWKGSPRVHWGAEDWPEAYRTRVDDFLATLTTPVEGSEGARVMWLGMPKVTSPSLERKLTLIRGVQADAIGGLGDEGVYLDLTPYIVNDQGELLRTARVKGKERELRAEDGVHFTMSGCEFLAEKIYPEVLAALGLPPEPSE